MPVATNSAMASDESRWLRAVDVTGPIVGVRRASATARMSGQRRPEHPGDDHDRNRAVVAQRDRGPEHRRADGQRCPAVPVASTRAPSNTTTTGNSDATVNVSPGATTSRTMFTSRWPAPGTNAPGPEPPTNVIRRADAVAPIGNAAALPVEPGATYVPSPSSRTASSPLVPWTRRPSGPPATRNIGGEALNANGKPGPLRCSVSHTNAPSGNVTTPWAITSAWPAATGPPPAATTTVVSGVDPDDPPGVLELDDDPDVAVVVACR